MRKSVALVLGVLVPLLGLAGVGNAQSTVQVQGTIQAVDCQSQTLVLATPNSTNTIAVAPYTAVLVDSRAVSLCDLQQYIGSSATVWLVASGNEFVATRIDTTAQATVAPVAAPVQESVNPLPIVGIVLGTILVAGLVYLLVRDNDRYYRYPYYGDYYPYYYHREYRPYYGWYPVDCPVVYAPAPLTGVVLGLTVINNYDYLVVREHDGHFARYPYYGPYRAHYYRAEYRPYNGPYAGYVNAPVRYGDWRNDGLVHRETHGPAAGPRPQPYQQPQPYNGRPNYTPVPQRPNYDYNRGPAQYQQPPRQQPYQQPQPYNGRPNYTPAPQRPNYDYNRGPAQYQQPRRPNYDSGNYNNRNYNRGPAQYQQPQRPSYNYNSGYNRGNGGGRGQDMRRNCNGQSDSCSSTR